jgi:hypothetical protein
MQQRSNAGEVDGEVSSGTFKQALEWRRGNLMMSLLRWRISTSNAESLRGRRGRSIFRRR